MTGGGGTAQAGGLLNTPQPISPGGNMYMPGATQPWATTPGAGTPTAPTGQSIGTGPGALSNAAAQGIGAGLTPFNPQYLDQLTRSLTSMQTRNLNENVLPGISQAGQQAGQYGGGSRAELAKGVAMRGMGEGIANTVAPLYQQGYEQALNRNMGAGGQAMSGLLGLGGLDIGRMNAETQAASAMANAAGAPQYTNPYLSGLGGFLSMMQMFQNWGNGSGNNSGGG